MTDEEIILSDAPVVESKDAKDRLDGYRAGFKTGYEVGEVDNILADYMIGFREGFKEGYRAGFLNKYEHSAEEQK